jgi:hypothetical protein
LVSRSARYIALFKNGIVLMVRARCCQLDQDRTVPEKRLVPVALPLWCWAASAADQVNLARRVMTDGSIAIIGGLLLISLPDGTGRQQLKRRPRLVSS